jgi:hypothetical protein
MKVEAVCSFKELMSTSKTAQCHSPQDHNIYCHENLKTYIVICLLVKGTVTVLLTSKGGKEGKVIWYK